jgi:hypothetical protein
MLPQPFYDLFVGGQTPALSPVGVEHTFLDIHIEQAERSLLHVRRDTELLLNGSRQTGGYRRPASLATI